MLALRVFWKWRGLQVPDSAGPKGASALQPAVPQFSQPPHLGLLVTQPSEVIDSSPHCQENPFRSRESSVTHCLGSGGNFPQNKHQRNLLSCVVGSVAVTLGTDLRHCDAL